MEELANLRLGELVSDLHRAKIRLGEIKAIYSTCSHFTVKATTGNMYVRHASYIFVCHRHGFAQQRRQYPTFYDYILMSLQ